MMHELYVSLSILRRIASLRLSVKVEMTVFEQTDQGFTPKRLFTTDIDSNCSSVSNIPSLLIYIL